MLRLAFAAMIVAGGATAQSDYGVPAELPPASFDGPQYVDSRGCAYVRAGVDGAVTWLPRITQDRQPVCGRTPTFPDGVPNEVAATKTTQAATDPATAPLVAPGMANPQIAATTARSATKTTPGATPPGFVRVWDDGRLNPRSGQGTPQGDAAMARIWTNEVPRRLVETPVEPVPDTYVAVAEFATNAQRDTVVRDLRRRGLPARHGVIRGASGDTPAVLLGPYPGAAQAAGGLQAVQSLGYRGAKIL